MAKAKKKAKARTRARIKAKRKVTGRPKRSSAKKAVKKKTVKKKVARNKAAKKKAVKRPARKASKKKVKKAASKPAKPATKKKPARTTASIPSAAAKEKQLEQQLMVEPGAPAGTIPSVEEPARHEEAVGVVTHYYSHLGVAVVQVNKDILRTGDTVHIKGHTTDFTQQAGSLEYEHQHVDEARAGQSVGLKVVDHAREHDIVYVVR